MRVFGCVVVGDKSYEDNEIVALCGKSTAGWKFGGDQFDDESNIYVEAEGHIACSFTGLDALERALAHLDNIRESMPS